MVRTKWSGLDTLTPIDRPKQKEIVQNNPINLSLIILPPSIPPVNRAPGKWGTKSSFNY